MTGPPEALLTVHSGDFLFPKLGSRFIKMESSRLVAAFISFCQAKGYLPILPFWIRHRRELFWKTSDWHTREMSKQMQFVFQMYVAIDEPVI